MSHEQFPLLQTTREQTLKSVPWPFIAPHERRALTNHGQSLRLLASRGGLDCLEALAVVLDLDCAALTETWPEIERQLAGLVAAWQTSAKPGACWNCGLAYADFPLDVTLPDQQWLDLNHGNTGGVLCAACIVALARARYPDAIAIRAVIERAPWPFPEHQRIARLLAQEIGACLNVLNRRPALTEEEQLQHTTLLRWERLARDIAFTL